MAITAVVYVFATLLGIAGIWFIFFKKESLGDKIPIGLAFLIFAGLLVVVGINTM